MGIFTGQVTRIIGSVIVEPVWWNFIFPSYPHYSFEKDDWWTSDHVLEYWTKVDLLFTLLGSNLDCQHTIFHSPTGWRSVMNSELKQVGLQCLKSTDLCYSWLIFPINKMIEIVWHVLLRIDGGQPWYSDSMLTMVD